MARRGLIRCACGLGGQGPYAVFGVRRGPCCGRELEGSKLRMRACARVCRETTAVAGCGLAVQGRGDLRGVVVDVAVDHAPDHAQQPVRARDHGLSGGEPLAQCAVKRPEGRARFDDVSGGVKGSVAQLVAAALGDLAFRGALPGVPCDWCAAAELAERAGRAQPADVARGGEKKRPVEFSQARQAVRRCAPGSRGRGARALPSVLRAGLRRAHGAASAAAAWRRRRLWQRDIRPGGWSSRSAA